MALNSHFIPMISVKINGVPVEVKRGTSVLDACTQAGVYVPTLCNHPDLPPAGKCGVCVVKINGSQWSLSCSTKCQAGMVIETNTPEVKARVAQAVKQFNDMPMMPNCKEIEDVMDFLTQKKPKRGRAAEETHALSFDPKKCINCGRCERQCAEGQAIGALENETHSLKENECISCGQCTAVCPTGALVEHNSIPQVMRALAAGKTMFFQCAPATRVAAGEPFGDPVGTIVTGKIVAAARQMGFKYVFDTNFAADMTIWEEGTELIHRLTNNGVIPMFTSCCPAWINFVEKIHPELIPNLSSAKSPHMMLGACIKSYFAEKKNIKPEDMFVVSMMPCTAKKDEIERYQMQRDVDAVLTVREFCKLAQDFGIDWKNLQDEGFDNIMGESTGAAALFGVTGGVMEAAVRFAHEALTKKQLGSVKYEQWRGLKGIKTAEVTIAGIKLNIAVCSGIASARDLIESGDYKEFTFIEVMACPNGCISGGGQPYLKTRKDAIKRAEAIYEIDRQLCGKNKVTSFNNSEIKRLYDEYMGKPNEGRAHHLLHTRYELQTTPLLEMKKAMESKPIVAYGSASGNAAKFARTLAGYMGSAAVALNQCGLQKMIKKGTVIILCSTFGDGEYPSNAIKFAEQLEANTERLDGLKYAVCGLGSREYPKFCAAAHAIDDMLARAGAQRLTTMIELDGSSPDKGEGVFEQWAPEIIGKLGLEMPEIVITPQYRLKYIEGKDAVSEEPMTPVGFDWGVMLSSTVLTPENYVPQMHRYQIKLPRGMTYVAGDHVAILPENDPQVVTEVLKVLKLNGDQVLEISHDLPEGATTIPEKVTIRQLFTQYLDLNGIPTRNLIRAFSQCCDDEFRKENYAKLLNPADPQPLNMLMRDCNIAEFIIERSKTGIPPLDVLMSAITLIRPRLYSIASAPEGSAGSIDLIITDNMFGDGNTRKGLCTSFLRRFGLTKVAIHTQTGCFGYPKDQNTPILMAALGCGVAPMLSLLQHRENIDGDIGNAVLFFGCRNKNTYPILDSILQNYVETGAMQDLYVAYSREGTSKTYITDLMKNNPDDVWRYWQDPRCEYFYCGPARGIPDELHTILVRITMEKGKMTREEAEKFCALHPHHVESF